jgi:two-component system alkaline phosphatase synthesis response regulator PhoP
LLRVLIVADATEQTRGLGSELVQNGFACSIASSGEIAVGQVTEQAPDLVLIAVDSSPATLGIRGLTQRIKQEKRLPVIALLSKAALGNLDSTLGIDDFVLEPWEATEVAVRAKRVLWRTNNIDSMELIKCGDLVIDLGKCEVSLDGRLVALTFKEYELLRFLASNRGRVFTREALLNKLWGYDYYGGDRTVDVHIRRLRSKIEDPTHTFIETVRNMGYRFQKEI